MSGLNQQQVRTEARYEGQGRDNAGRMESLRSWPSRAAGVPGPTLDHRVPQRESGRNASIGTMKARVLVVDDDPALAEMLTIVLRGEGFDTAVVGDELPEGQRIVVRLAEADVARRKVTFTPA